MGVASVSLRCEVQFELNKQRDLHSTHTSMLALHAGFLALVLSVISLQELWAAPNPVIENAAFTSGDLLAEESAPVLKRLRRHHGEGYFYDHHHKGFGYDYWHKYNNQYFPSPGCHHSIYDFGPNPWSHHGFDSHLPAPGEHQHLASPPSPPYKAKLSPFKGGKTEIKSESGQPSTSSLAPPITTTTESTTPSPTTISTEDAPLDIDLRLGQP